MSERSRDLKRRLRASEVTIGAWLSLADPEVAEIMAQTGFDWLLIDTEHTPFTLKDLEIALMAFNGEPTVPIVRVAWNDPVRIKQALDLGAEGILVPWVSSPDEAQRAVAACKYPPMGVRGFGPRRASRYYANVDAYIARANEDLIVAVQIEHIRAVAVIGDILDVPGIDVVLLGPMDLSGSMGLLGQVDHPDVIAAIEAVIAEAQRHGIPAGVPLETTPEQLLAWAQRGCRFVITGEDHGFMRRAAVEALATFRQAAQRGGGQERG